MFVNAIMFCCLFLFQRFIYLYAVLHHMMHWDWYFMYTSHQYRIYLHICHFELVHTRTNVWNQFPLFRGCGVHPQFTFCVYSNLSISSWPESQTETSQQQHSLLVLTPRPSIALVSPQCALCTALGARFIWMRTFLQSANHHPQTLYCTSHFLLSCALITNVWPQHAHMWCEERHSHQMSNDATQRF